MIKLVLGDIQETVYYGQEDADIAYKISADDLLQATLTDFCIDRRGAVRKALGIVNMGGEEFEFNPEYVPVSRWELNHAPWNAHSNYVILDLPNPASDADHYTLVRTSMLNEFARRLKIAERKVKRRKS